MLEPSPHTLDAARRGDRDAVADVVAALQPHLWRFIAALERDTEAVADLTQETLVKVLRGLAGFRGDARLRTWAFAIARNVVRDHQRSIARRPRLVALDSTADRAGEPNDPSLRLRLDDALAQLIRPLREVFVLVEVSGLRYREVAEILDIPEGTVKSRMFRARAELIRLLDGGEPDAPSRAADGGGDDDG